MEFTREETLTLWIMMRTIQNEAVPEDEYRCQLLANIVAKLEDGVRALGIETLI